MNDKDVFALLKQLADIPGPVGHEDPVQQALEKDWKKQGIKTSRDKVGNLFGRVEGSGPHLAIIGHADSLGFIVQQILPDGFVKLAPNTAASPPDARFLPGVPLQFLTGEGGTVEGHFGLRSGHLVGSEGKKDPVVFDDMFIDLGLDSADAVRQVGIDIGTSAVYAVKTAQRQLNIVGPSMDNRVAGTMQCMLARALNENEDRPNLTFISTVQEEIGMKGASAAAKKVDCDAAIVVDVGIVGDIPTSKGDYMSTKLGAGPIVLYKDNSIHYSPDLIAKIEKKATKSNIPFQRGVFKNYSTDGVHFFQQGIPTAMIGVPCRYTHTPFETVRANDMVRTFDLLYRLIVS
jgi:putative aminopeptidase FrvX